MAYLHHTSVYDRKIQFGTPNLLYIVSKWNHLQSVIFLKIINPLCDECTYQPYMEHQYTTQVILFVISVTLDLYGSICESFSF